MGDRVRVLVADDSPAMRVGLREILGNSNEIEVVGEAVSVTEIKQKVLDSHPDVLVMDLRWYGDDEEGIRIIRNLVLELPDIRVVAISAYPRLLDTARGAGAVGGLHSIATEDEIINTVVRAPGLKPLKVLSGAVEGYCARLDNLPMGIEAARAYEELIFDVVRFLFEGHLESGQLGSRSAGRVHIRDVIFLNVSGDPFWAMVRTQHDGRQIVIECKNVRILDRGHVRQLAAYLGGSLGRFGLLVARNKPVKGTYQEAVRACQNDKKIILILTDEDLRQMLDGMTRRVNPVQVLRWRYSELTRQA